MVHHWCFVFYVNIKLSAWNKTAEREWDLDLQDLSSSSAHHLSAVTLDQQ